MDPDPVAAIASLGLTLPPTPRPAGSYSPVVVEGSLAWVSGQIASHEGSIVHPGLVDSEVDVASAQESARLATLQGLSALAAELGGLDHIRRILRVGVFVASSPGFTQQHVVADGATGLLIQLFGAQGRPARASVGVARLPLNAPVEVELLVAKR